MSPIVLRPINANGAVTNQAKMYESRAKLKDYNKRTKKAASLISQTVDDNIVMSLDVHKRDPRTMWGHLARDYNIVMPVQRMAARKVFVDMTIPEESTHLDIKHNFNELLKKVTMQGGAISVDEPLQASLEALRAKYGVLC